MYSVARTPSDLIIQPTESVQVSKDNMKNLQDEFEELKKTSDELLQRDKLGKFIFVSSNNCANCHLCLFLVRFLI